MWILIPAKSPELAKSRLAPVLSAEARAVLARVLLARVLTVITDCRLVSGAVVISEDAGLRAIAQLFGFHSLPDPDLDLNRSLEAGRAYAIARGATAVMILPTDLPCLSREALEAFLAHTSDPGPRIVIAMDQHRVGTNALFQRPADAIPFCFGVGSARRHMALAANRSIPVAEVVHPALAFDLDLPEDWARLVA